MVLDAVARACALAAFKARIELSHGMTSLASVASTAPFLGIMGTLMGIFASFKGVAGNAVSIRAAVAWGLSNALLPTALGVLVALLAHWGRKHLLAKLNDLDVEMKMASLELVNELSRYSA